MIVKHKRTGDLYRMLLNSFSTERQAPSMVYMKIDTGEIFDRDFHAFIENFEILHDAQAGIQPRDKNQTEMVLEQPNEEGTRDIVARQIR